MNLVMEAAKICNELDDHFSVQTADYRQVLTLAEEVGEFVGAFRRWKNLARRTGTYDEMADELADIVIAAYVTADVLGIDLDERAEEKILKIHERGWKDKR